MNIHIMKTYLYINAYLLADESQKASLDRWAEYDGKDEQAKIDGVRSIYDAVGVRHMSEKLIDDLFSQALEKLDRVSLPDERKRLLKEYAESLMNRVL